MALTALSNREQAVVDIVYRDCLPRLKQVVGSFIRQYGGDYDDYFSLAQQTFIDAYRRYNAKKHPDFVAYACWLVRCKMLDHRRQVLERNSRNPMLGGDSLETVVVNTSDFDYGDFLASLSDDSRYIVELAMTYEGPPQKPSRVRKQVYDHLTKKAKWTVTRVRECLREIQTLLGG